MMRPPAERLRCGTASLVATKAARRFTAMMRSNSASGSCCESAMVVMPALLTTMSRPPSWSTVRCTSAWSCRSSATSVGTNSARPPRSAIAAAVGGCGSVSW